MYVRGLSSPERVARRYPGRSAAMGVLGWWPCQGRYAMREIVNAPLYQGRTRCQWDLLPHDFPPPGAVKYYFNTWRDDGTDQTIHDLLRWQVREKACRK